MVIRRSAVHPIFVETFFLAEEKRALRTQNFQDLSQAWSGGDGPVRSGYSDLDLGQQGYRFDETRLDLSVGAVLDDHTRFDVPAFDETRLDNMRTAVLLAPPADQPRAWAEDTSLDDLDVMFVL